MQWTAQAVRQTEALEEVAGRPGTYGQGQTRGETHTEKRAVQQPEEREQEQEQEQAQPA